MSTSVSEMVIGSTSQIGWVLNVLWYAQSSVPLKYPIPKYGYENESFLDA